MNTRLRSKPLTRSGSAESAAITVRTVPPPAVLSSDSCAGLDFPTLDDAQNTFPDGIMVKRNHDVGDR